MSSPTSLKDTLNVADPTNTNSVFNDMQLGTLLSTLISNASMTQTSAAVTTTTYSMTLATAATAVFQVNVKTVVSGGTAGVKTLLQGPVSGTGAITPAAGQVVWDGASALLFAAADKPATVDLLYAISTTKASVLEKGIGE